MQQPAWKRSKVRELGVFAVGLGAILMALTAWIIWGVRRPGPPVLLSRAALLLIPGFVMAVSGVLLLVLRSRMCVKMTVAVLTLAFVADALLSFNPVKLLISGGCVYLIWKTGRQALTEFPAPAST